MVAVVLAIAATLLLSQAAASDSGSQCRFGAISAIGPVDEQGQGDTTPDLRCIEP